MNYSLLLQIYKLIFNNLTFYLGIKQFKNGQNFLEVKTIMQYQLNDDTIQVHSKFTRELSLKKNLFEMNEDNHPDPIKKNQKTLNKQTELIDPLTMDSAMMAHLFTERIASLIIFASIIVSLFQIYDHHEDDENLYIMGYAFTIFLIINTIISHYLKIKKDKARSITKKYNFLVLLINLAIVIPHPNKIFNQYDNYLLHFLMILRLNIPLKYIVISSIYHNSRGHRLVQIYGMTPDNHFWLSSKAMFKQVSIFMILFIYVMFVLVFSHCLYLLGLYSHQEGSFLDYYQIVMVTMPTVGYGDYTIGNSEQRFLIVVVLILSACLNSFITLTMLQWLDMSSRQQSSYKLLKKLTLRAKMQKLSKQYIIEQIRLIRSKSKDQQQKRILDSAFHIDFGLEKAQYSSLSTNEMDKNFTYFKETLHQFNIKSRQTDNMVNTVIRKLTSYRQELYSRKECNHQLFNLPDQVN